MALRLTNAAASAGAGDGSNAGVRAYIGATPKLKFFTGAVPASAEDNPAGTLLATVTVGAFGAATNGAIVSAGGSVAAAESGLAGCWALYKTDGTTKVIDGSAGEAAEDIAFDEADWLAGGTVAVGTITLTLPPH